MILENINWDFISSCFLDIGILFIFWECCIRTKKLKRKVNSLEVKAKQRDKFLNTLSIKIAAFEIQGRITKAVSKPQKDKPSAFNPYDDPSRILCSPDYEKPPFTHCDYCKKSFKKAKGLWGNDPICPTVFYCSAKCCLAAIKQEKETVEKI